MPSSADITGWTLVSGTTYSQAAAYGTVTLNTATGALTSTLDTTNAATNALGFAVHVPDDVSVSSYGTHRAPPSFPTRRSSDLTNDLPTISQVAPTVTLVEAGVGPGNTAVAGTGTAGATLTIGDPDTGDTASFDLTGWTLVSGATYSQAVAYGNVTLNTATGALTYTLDNTKAATNALGFGVHVTDDVTVTTNDTHGASAAQTVTFHIDGTNDLPTISQVAPTVTPVKATLALHDALPICTGTAGATLTIGDPDTGDTASFDLTGWTLVS